MSVPTAPKQAVFYSVQKLKKNFMRREEDIRKPEKEREEAFIETIAGWQRNDGFTDEDREKILSFIANIRQARELNTGSSTLPRKDYSWD